MLQSLFHLTELMLASAFGLKGVMHTSDYNEYFHSVTFLTKAFHRAFVHRFLPRALRSRRIVTPLSSGNASLREWKTHKTQL